LITVKTTNKNDNKNHKNMTSKKIGSPLCSIFQQWTAQQQQGDDHTRSSSYNILLQTSYSLRSRVAAAEPVENPNLYKRAGVSTPSEKASRDIYGGSETGWLLRLLKLAMQQQASNESSSSSNMVFVKTRAQSSLVRELTEEHRQRLTVVDLVAGGPFGWDDDEEDCGCNIHNLRTVHRRLVEEVSSKSAPVILVWQSLTPLLTVHGFPRILRLLTALPKCLQVWTVHGQALTPSDHGRLEDAANALLCLQGGQTTLVRQGIREPGNILRQQLPFRLVQTTANGRYRVSEEDDENDDDIHKDIHDDPNATQKEDKQNPPLKHNSSNHQTTDTETASPTKTSRSARGARLRIEENDGGRSNDREDHEASSGSNPRPRIYLQDDDPEFDDFDEEDPDDDLEL
jgi:hypothetical protein